MNSDIDTNVATLSATVGDALQVIDAEIDALEQTVAGLSSNSFVFLTRAAAVTALNSNPPVAGALVQIGDLSYLYQPGATVIADMPNFVSADATYVTARHHGAVLDGVADDQPAMMSALAEYKARLDAGQDCWLMVEPGVCRLGDEIAVSAVLADADVFRMTALCQFVVDFDGRGKAVFNIWYPNGDVAKDILIDGDVRIKGRNAILDPMALYMRKVSTGSRISNVTISNVANVAVFAEEVDNTVFSNVRITGGRAGQLMKVDLKDTRVDTNGTAFVVTDNNGDPAPVNILNGMSGHIMGFADAGLGVAEGFPTVTSLNADKNGGTVGRDLGTTSGNRTTSTAAVVSGVDGQNYVTLDIAGNHLSADWVGSHAIIEKMDAGDTFMLVRITGVDLPNNRIILSHNVQGTFTDGKVYTCGGVWISEVGSRNTFNDRRTNEVHFYGLVVEKTGGVGFYNQGGTGLNIIGGKFHGTSPSDFNWGAAGPFVLCNSLSRTMRVDTQVDIVNIPQSAAFVIERSGFLSVNSVSVGTVCETSAIAEIGMRPGERGGLKVNVLETVAGPYGGLLKFRDNGVNQRKHLLGWDVPWNETRTNGGTIPFVPSKSGQYPTTTIASNTLLRFKTWEDHTTVSVSTDSSSDYNALFNARFGLQGGVPKAFGIHQGAAVNYIEFNGPMSNYTTAFGASASLNLVVCQDGLVVHPKGIGANLDYSVTMTGKHN